MTPPRTVRKEHDRIVRDLRLIADSYRRLATAARTDDRPAFNASRVQVRRREAQLDALLGSLRDEGYRTG